MTPSVPEPATAPVDRLEAGPTRPARPALVRGVLRGLLAAVVASVLLAAFSVVTATGWRAPGTVAPLPVVPVRVVPIWLQHLPYAFVDRVDTVTAAGLPARIVRPRGAQGTIPGVVLVDDVGPTSRDDLAEEAEVFARGGLAVLTYDKRTEGYGPLRRSYGRLADDALAALTTMARQPGVDPGRVGLLGLGEGSWVVPVAADREPDRVAFTVLVSAPVVSPLEQAAWAVDQRLTALPVPVRRAVAASLVLEGGVVRRLGTDVRPELTSSARPSFALWGAQDTTIPVAVAVGRYRAAVGPRGRVEVVPGTGHRLGTDTGWAERVSDWVRQGYPPDDQVRGAQPVAQVGLPTLPRPGWPSDPWLRLAVAASVGVVAAVRPARRGRVRSARSG